MTIQEQIKTARSLSGRLFGAYRRHNKPFAFGGDDLEAVWDLAQTLAGVLRLSDVMPQEWESAVGQLRLCQEAELATEVEAVLSAARAKRQAEVKRWLKEETT